MANQTLQLASVKAEMGFSKVALFVLDNNLCVRCCKKLSKFITTLSGSIPRTVGHNGTCSWKGNFEILMTIDNDADNVDDDNEDLSL